MKKVHKLVAVCLLTPLFMACSKGPTEAEIETLIQSELDEAYSMADAAIAEAKAESPEAAKMMEGMMEKMTPKFKGVENLECQETEVEDTYSCTADVTMSINDKDKTENGKFEVKKVDGKWVAVK